MADNHHTPPAWGMPQQLRLYHLILRNLRSSTRQQRHSKYREYWQGTRVESWPSQNESRWSRRLEMWRTTLRRACDQTVILVGPAADMRTKATAVVTKLLRESLPRFLGDDINMPPIMRQLLRHTLEPTVAFCFRSMEDGEFRLSAEVVVQALDAWLRVATEAPWTMADAAFQRLLQAEVLLGVMWLPRGDAPLRRLLRRCAPPAFSRLPPSKALSSFTGAYALLGAPPASFHSSHVYDGATSSTPPAPDAFQAGTWLVWLLLQADGSTRLEAWQPARSDDRVALALPHDAGEPMAVDVTVVCAEPEPLVAVLDSLAGLRLYRLDVANAQWTPMGRLVTALPGVDPARPVWLRWVPHGSGGIPVAVWANPTAPSAVADSAGETPPLANAHVAAWDAEELALHPLPVKNAAHVLDRVLGTVRQKSPPAALWNATSGIARIWTGAGAAAAVTHTRRVLHAWSDCCGWHVVVEGSAAFTAASGARTSLWHASAGSGLRPLVPEALLEVAAPIAMASFVVEPSQGQVQQARVPTAST